MEMETGLWVGLVVGILPLLGLCMWWWNDYWYAFPITLRQSSTGGPTLPPGHMGLPLFGEMLKFLWYFNVIRQPDEYINDKRRKYGDGVGLYRTHLFGSPTIIACTASASKFVLQKDSNFPLEWPTVEIVGATSIVAVNGESHTRIRSFVVRAINQPDALRVILLMVQPRIVTALESWAEKGRITAYREARKVTFANIGKYFASFEPGPVLDGLDVLFNGLLDGVRAYPLNFPGTAFHRALQCRKKVIATFREEMERRKKEDKSSSSAKNDLMEGLMQMKDDDGNKLSDMEVLDNIVSFIVAGYTSTSLAIMWAFYYLAKYPNVLQKLREEHSELNKKKSGQFVTYDEIFACNYTNKVVEEIIRLGNIAPFVFRTSKDDIEYKGHIIPKGWQVVCWLRYLHTDPQNFEDPMCFNPDRWNQSPKPGSYAVFGGGSRICAGNMLARLQVSVLLHHLVVRYRWELVNPDADILSLSHRKPVDGVVINISKI